MEKINNFITRAQNDVQYYGKQSLGTAVNVTLQISAATTAIRGASMVGEVVRRVAGEVFAYPSFVGAASEKAWDLAPDMAKSFYSNITFVPYRNLNYTQLLISGAGLCALGTLSYRGAQFVFGDVSHVFNRVLAFTPFELSGRNWSATRAKANRALGEERTALQKSQGTRWQKASALAQAAAFRIPTLTMIATSVIMAGELGKRGIAEGLKHVGVVLQEPAFMKEITARIPVPELVRENFNWGIMERASSRDLAISAAALCVIGGACYELVNYFQPASAMYNSFFAYGNVVQLRPEHVGVREKFAANIHGETRC